MLRIILSFIFLIPISIGCTNSNAASEFPKAKIYKRSTCDCCNKWIDHLKENDFDAKGIDVQDMNAVKSERGIPQHLTPSAKMEKPAYTTNTIPDKLRVTDYRLRRWRLFMGT